MHHKSKLLFDSTVAHKIKFNVILDKQNSASNIQKKSASCHLRDKVRKSKHLFWEVSLLRLQLHIVG